MKIFLLPLVTLILLVLQSVLTEVIPSSFLDGMLYIPHWPLVISIIVMIFYDREHSYVGLMNGLAFAFLTDLTFTSILGVYLLGYGVSLYVIHLLKRVLHKNFLVSIVFVLLGVAIADLIIFGVYFLIGQVMIGFQDYLTIRLVPSLIVNVIGLLILYPLTKPMLTKWKYELEK
ncbi:rod shape-determining protein MreD [Alkalibacillus sp. S2W]|uniref:rod shape-determining protein MreD n=1 Tax=Alkalibacillus TaxID=331654 RepID=UPI001421FBC5|nr:rod shape-determining protein MreD [Alkalibacillus almallahensis]NIK11241.1 rod shape-determining protein MreD [Alkalibacillus almallahensis]